MGNSQSSSAAEAAASRAATGPAGPCPVVGADAQPGAAAPAEAPATASRCPVPVSARATAIYNVYGQRIDTPAPGGEKADPLAVLRDSDMLDPKNNMPLAPNQQPCPGQRRLLSTERMESNIPKGGTDETWVYPSPQMFFNGRWPGMGVARGRVVPPAAGMAEAGGWSGPIPYATQPIPSGLPAGDVQPHA
jgi:cytochrome c heme-lyase